MKNAEFMICKSVENGSCIYNFKLAWVVTVGKMERFLPLSIVKCDNIICVSLYANRMNSLVLRVRGDEVAHPGGHGGDLAGGAALDQFEVLLHGAVRVRVHVHAR